MKSVRPYFLTRQRGHGLGDKPPKTSPPQFRRHFHATRTRTQPKKHSLVADRFARPLQPDCSNER